jgi:hypothetical protein
VFVGASAETAVSTIMTVLLALVFLRANRLFRARRPLPLPRTLADIRAALEAEGVEFINGDAPGVRLRRRKD